MNNAKVSYTIVLCVLCMGAAASFAQDAAKPPESTAQPIPTLPTSLKGEMGGYNPQNYKVQSNPLQLQIASQSAEGKVSGAYSRSVRYWGTPENLCVQASNLPAEGTYDGEKLVLKVKGSQNSNTCEDYTITFVRGKEHYFERTLPNGWTAYLDPVK
jgi:hypothetical protein